MSSKQSTTAVLLSRWYSGLQEDDDIRWRQQIIVIDACRLLCVVVEQKFFMDQHFCSKTSMSRAIPSPPLLLTRINAWFTAHAIKHIISGHLKTDRARSNSRMNFKRRTVTESRHSRQSYPQKRILCTEIPIPRRWMTMSWEIWRRTKVICGNPASRPRAGTLTRWLWWRSTGSELDKGSRWRCRAARPRNWPSLTRSPTFSLLFN